MASCTMQRIHKADRCLECKECDVMYFIAKAIAEEFEWHEIKIRDRNENAGENELWSIASTSVYFNVKTHKLEVETVYFNEFRTDRSTYSFVGTVSDSHLRTYVDFAEVIKMYIKYFDDDYHCSFEWKNW